tara:strand:+ start:37 stop:549 length:513 start_codon:yes stop_codon:yes gene_type:complete
MKSNKNIVLVGMMGSGKSSIGKKLAETIELDFVDIDNKIEEIENMLIIDIFKKKGEGYFRKIEENISLSYLKLNKKVISLGGGGYINPKIRQQCSKNCTSIWLKWKSQTLIDRIKNSKKRPLAKKMDYSEIKKMIFQRSKIYNFSDYKINCDNLKKFEIVKKIIRLNEQI